MHRYDLAYLSDSVLLRDLTALVAQDRSTTASLLAHIAEVDARRLYAPAGCSSMFAYCVEKLRLSEDATARRIHAARAGRRFPALFEALEEGRLHLTAIFLLAPHLTPGNAEELIEASIHRPKVEIESLLARRFPSPDRPTVVRALSTSRQHALEHVACAAAPLGLGEPIAGSIPPNAPDPIPLMNEHALEHAHRPESDLWTERYLVQVTIPKSTHDKLRHAQALLSHVVSRRDVAQVLDRALDALIAELEKRKFGAPKATNQSRQLRRRRSGTSRYIPAHIRRAVWERDQGRCTFVSERGTPCNAREHLEFDHVEPVAQGGRASVEGIRLRCRAHNQLEAERAFGGDFMRRKRNDARVTAAKKREARLAAARARARAEAEEQSRDVLAGLRSLGCRADEARRAAEFSETARGGTLEERMRVALQFLNRRSARPGLHSPARVSATKA